MAKVNYELREALIRTLHLPVRVTAEENSIAGGVTFVFQCEDEGIMPSALFVEVSHSWLAAQEVLARSLYWLLVDRALGWLPIHDHFWAE